MHVTIIREDNAVGVDGYFLTIDCSILPNNFHALQWDGPEDGIGGVGEVEWTGNPKPPNEPITDLGGYYVYVEAWREEKQRLDDLAAAAAQQPPAPPSAGPTVVAE
jgi:hypothetical protein